MTAGEKSRPDKIISSLDGLRSSNSLHESNENYINFYSLQTPYA